MAYVEKFYKEITNKDSRIILFSELASLKNVQNEKHL